jgi:NAD(P)H dehydrogenase (quinone)
LGQEGESSPQIHKAAFAEQERLRGFIIVNMSQASARGDAFSDTTIDHWVSEHLFDWSGVKTTHIRPTFFFDWFLYFAKRCSGWSDSNAF